MLWQLSMGIMHADSTLDAIKKEIVEVIGNCKSWLPFPPPPDHNKNWPRMFSCFYIRFILVFLVSYWFHIGFILVLYSFYIGLMTNSKEWGSLCRLDPPADALELWGGICISFLDISRLWDILVVVCDRICYQPNADFEEIPSSEVQMCFISDLGSACICIQQYSMCGSLDQNISIHFFGSKYINTFLQNIGGAVYIDHSWHETDFCC